MTEKFSVIAWLDRAKELRGSLTKAAFILFAAFSLTGCAYHYNVAVKNTGQQEIRCTFLGSSEGFAHEPGRLIAGATAGFSGPFKYPYADVWTVSWRTADGQEISKKLDLTDTLPKGFEGHLIFTISAKNDLGYVTEKFSWE